MKNEKQIPDELKEGAQTEEHPVGSTRWLVGVARLWKLRGEAAPSALGATRRSCPARGCECGRRPRGRHAGEPRAQQATLREQEQGHIKAAGGPRVVGAHPPRRPRGGNLLGTTLSLCPEGLRAEASEPLGGRNFLTA